MTVFCYGKRSQSIYEGGADVTSKYSPGTPEVNSMLLTCLRVRFA